MESAEQDVILEQQHYEKTRLTRLVKDARKEVFSFEKKKNMNVIEKMLGAWNIPSHNILDDKTPHFLWRFTPEKVFDHLSTDNCQYYKSVEKFIFYHDVVTQKKGHPKFYVYGLIVDGLHQIHSDTTDLNKLIYEDIHCQYLGCKAKKRIHSIRLPMMLMFTNKLNTNTDLFTKTIELQHKMFIGPLDDTPNGKCIYLLIGFWVRDDERCVSYIRKNNSESVLTQNQERWYKCNVTRKIPDSTNDKEFINDLFQRDVTGKWKESTDQYKLADELNSYCGVEVERPLRTVLETVVSNNEKQNIVCLYEASINKNKGT